MRQFFLILLDKRSFFSQKKVFVTEGVRAEIFVLEAMSIRTKRFEDSVKIFRFSQEKIEDEWFKLMACQDLGTFMLSEALDIKVLGLCQL